MINDLFKVTHATGTVTFTADAITGINRYSIDGKSFVTNRMAYEVARHEYGTITFKEAQILLSEEEDNDIEQLGFNMERVYCKGKSDGFGAINVALADNKLELPVFRYLVSVCDQERFYYYFVKTMHDLAELLGKLKVLGESDT